MTRWLTRVVNSSYRKSPQENLRMLRRKVAFLMPSNGTANKVIPGRPTLTPSLCRFIALRLSGVSRRVVLLGPRTMTDPITSALEERSCAVVTVDWTWEQGVEGMRAVDGDGLVLVCEIPQRGEHWHILQRLRDRLPSRLMSLHEVLLPITLLEVGQARLEYYLEELETILPYYLGEQEVGPIAALNRLFPLRDQRVIEFGVLDGCQTAGLIKYGVRSVTGIDARADNVIKAMIARQLCEWTNVQFVLDDFHHVDRRTYGRYDLVVAHGVYYHSFAPFLFLENLLSLSDNVFMGGFCATDTFPKGRFETLSYHGSTYRAKPYKEGNWCASGINAVGYYFHRDDLLKFFAERTYRIDVMSEEPSRVTAGLYLRFLARSQAS